MRKPRDIDAELRELAERAKGLKAKRVMQLGELVTITGADTLDHATLAGALLAAVAETNSASREAWRQAGQTYFQRRPRSPKVRPGNSIAEDDRRSTSSATSSGDGETGADGAGA